MQIVTDVLSIVAVAEGHGQISPAQLAKIQAVAAQAESDLALIQSLVADYQKQPTVATLQKIQAAIQVAQDNLAALLAAAHVKDPATATAITSAVGLAMTTLLAIEALLPASQASSARHAQQGAPKLPSPQKLQSDLNKILRNAGYGNLAR